MSWDKERVRQLRQKLSLTQMELAQTLGCRQQTISEWEQGLYAPANAYGKLLDQLEKRSNLSAGFLMTRPEGHSRPPHRPTAERFSSWSHRQAPESSQASKSFPTSSEPGAFQSFHPPVAKVDVPAPSDSTDQEFQENSFDNSFDPGID